MAARNKPVKRDEIAQRRQIVANLRLSHLTQAEIAERLGVSVGTISSDMAAIRDEWADRRRSSYDEWVAEEIAKLDRLERTFMPQAIQGVREAADKVLQIMDRRARMLGLDKPQLHTHTVITRDAIDAEIERLERELEIRELREADVEQ